MKKATARGNTNRAVALRAPRGTRRAGRQGDLSGRGGRTFQHGEEDIAGNGAANWYEAKWCGRVAFVNGGEAWFGYLVATAGDRILSCDGTGRGISGRLCVAACSA